MTSLGFYQITYSNGMIQIKNLISQSDFNEKVVPLYLEIEKYKLNNNHNKVNKTKKYLKDTYGESFFTTESPIYLAKDSGILGLYEHCGGNHKIEVKLINNKIEELNEA